MKSQIILSLISGAFLAIGAYLWKKGNRLLLYGKKTQATVIDNEVDDRGRNGTYYYPIITFMTDGNKEVGHKFTIGSMSPMEKGTVINIVYDPEDPSIVSQDSRTMLELVPRVFVVAGLFGLVLVLFEVFELTALLE